MEILLLSHGDFADGLLESYIMIAGENDLISTLKLTDEGIGSFQQELEDFLDDKTKTKDVLVLCDLPGGTPYNESLRYQLGNPNKIKVVSGMNLPMLIEIGMSLDTAEDIEELLEVAMDSGKSGIQNTESII